MKKKILGLVSVFILSVGLLTGCGSSTSDYEEYLEDEGLYSTSSSEDYSVEEYGDVSSSKGIAESVEEVELGEGDVDHSEIEKNAVSSRKIVYTAEVNIQTSNYAKNVEVVKSLVKKYGGYFESTNLNGTEKAKDRSASFTIRIPVDTYDKFMDGVGEIDTVVFKSETADDITSQYVDVQARLKSLNTKRDRLEQFEEQATKLEDVLDLENQITDVQYEIERYTATLNAYKDMTSNCTINMYIEEVHDEVEIDPDKRDTFSKRMREAFAGSIAAFQIIVEGLITIVIYIFPYAIIATIVIFIVVKVSKSEKHKKRAEEKKKKQLATKQAYTGPNYSAKTEENTEEKPET